MSDNTPSFISWLLAQSGSLDETPQPSLMDWKAQWDQFGDTWKSPADRAIIGGFLADRLAYAFAAGYFSALQRLVPKLPEKAISAFCVSEKEGGHPRAIKTTLESHPSDSNTAESWKMNGTKTFVTCAIEVDILLVVASTGTDNSGRNQLKMVQLPRDTAGMKVIPREKMSFIPEVSHGIVELTDVEVTESQILPGDGYSDYVRPFGIIEDIHILAANTGYILRLARLNNWPPNISAEVLAILSSARTLSGADPKSPDTQITLAGLQSLMRNQLIRIEPQWEKTSDETRSRWERDRALFSMGQKAGEIRLQSAWDKF
jgi:acyl-CoA dehydrogenase